MGYITKREKVERLNKIYKSNCVKKFLIIVAVVLALWVLIFALCAWTLSVAGDHDEFNIFILAPGEAGNWIGQIKGLTILGWAFVGTSLLSIVFDIIAFVATIKIKSTKSIIAEAIEIVTFA